MEIRIEINTASIDWRKVAGILQKAGMAFYAPQMHQKAFENSQITAFAWHEEQMIGCGRALTDFAYQAALYDIAILPEYQGQGVGRMLIESLLAQMPGCNVILYASPGKEPFYEKLGFRHMKTGMARFLKERVMQERGFTD